MLKLSQISIENLSNITSSVILISTSFFIMACCYFVSRHYRSAKNAHKKLSFIEQATLFLIQVAKKPFIFILMVYMLVEAITVGCIAFADVLGKNAVLLTQFAKFTENIVNVMGLFWFILNTLNLGEHRLEFWLVKHDKRTLSILLPMLSKSIKAAIVLLMINMLIPELGLTGLPNEAFQKGAKVSLILILAWLFVQMVNGFEKLILNQYSGENVNVFATRKVNTQILILKKVILTLAVVVTIAAILMVFDSVKNLGTGLLTTAGLLSAVGAFASQQSLGRIFAGLQIAFTQTISIGDTVIVDKESGQIEEITLSYIVIKLWDLRRLILPADYFTSKSLQNLTRSSTELLGTIFIYVDYTLPVDKLRKVFEKMVSESKLWNGQVCQLQVTETKETTMELRGLLSAANSSELFALRCEIRERIVGYIVQNYPESLPKTRNLSGESAKALSREEAVANTVV